MHLIYAMKLDFCTKKINISMQKIDESYLNIFEIIIVYCLVKDTLRKVYFFQKLFLLANINLEIVLEIFFLSLNKGDIRFAEKKLV